jgi:hypothetical protein
VAASPPFTPVTPDSASSMHYLPEDDVRVWNIKPMMTYSDDLYSGKHH